MNTEWKHMGITCHHNADRNAYGLCEHCVQQFNLDPIEWLEYGPHPQGDENWSRLCRETDCVEWTDDDVITLAPDTSGPIGVEELGENMEGNGPEEPSETTNVVSPTQREDIDRGYRYGHSDGIPF